MGSGRLLRGRVAAEDPATERGLVDLVGTVIDAGGALVAVPVGQHRVVGDTERTIIQFAREVISEDKVSSETFARALAIFGREGVTDLTGLIGYYSFVAITLKAFDVQRAVGSQLLLPIRAD